MDYIDLNSSDLNSRSDFDQSSSIPSPQAGGFFGLFEDSAQNVDNKALKLARNRDFDGLLSLVETNQVSNCDRKDEFGTTLLHYVVPFVGKDVKAAKVFQRLMSRSDVNRFIDVQNNEGCTPLHIAVEVGANDLADALVRAGASTDIADSKGRKIEAYDVTVDTPASEYAPLPDVLGELSQATVDAGVESLMKVFQQINSAAQKNTLGADADTAVPTEGRARLADTVASPPHRVDSPASPPTEAFLDSLLNRYGNRQSGGGAKPIRAGQRPLRVYGSAGSVNRSARQTEVGRMINNQATEIHHRVIKKIMEMMTVDETEARVVKAAIYRHIKDNHPELSNLDRALEMEKNTTKEFIDTLDIEKTRSDMKKHYAEKDKMKAEKEKAEKKVASSSDSASTPTEKPAKKVAAKKASAKTTVAKKTKKAAAKSEVSASESAYTPESASSEYLSELDQMITLDSPTSMIEYTE